MAVVQKPVRILYQAKGNTTGLTDVKAQIYLNGVAKAVGSSAVVLTETDPTNNPGFYELFLSAATLTGYGVTVGQLNCIDGSINSVTQPAKAPFREELTVANLDDINTVLGTPTTTSIAGDIAAVKSVIGTPAGASVSADIAALASNVQALQNGTIGNGVGFVLPLMIIPSASGGNAQTFTVSSANATAGATYSNNSQTFTVLNTISAGTTLQASGTGAPLASGTLTKVSGTGDATIAFSAAVSANLIEIPLTINNNDGALIDPNSNLVTIGVKNAAGTDRGSILIGSSGSPAVVAATRTSTGEYVAYGLIPSTEVEEQLVFSFSYTVGTNAMVRFGVSQTVTDVNSAGYAQQTTLLAVQTTVNTINSLVSNATYGLAALYALLTNGTSGLSAIAALLNSGTNGLVAINSNVSSVGTAVATANATLTNSTYGLPALQTNQASLLAGQASIQGSGFSSTSNSLVALTAAVAAVQASIFVGGRAV